ncbi:MAG: phosphate/phosphite/phosphonate ABC transporter substrate-binding protein [Candidatus Sedimenticola sp. (ex Thyasira tokunagai)]
MSRFASRNRRLAYSTVVGRTRLSSILSILLLLSLCFPLSSIAVSAETSNGAATPGQTLSFGVYAHIRSTEMIKKMRPFQEYMERKLARKGVPLKIRMRIFPTYNDAIHALVEGRVDFVRFGPVSYVLAKQKNPRIHLLAMESNNGKKWFSGVISVPLDSPIRSLDDLKGKRFAFGSRSSTTGRYLAQAALVKAGIRAENLAGHAYLGRHDKVAFAVASKSYDAGATNENTYNKYAEKKGLRKIVEFPCVTKPWVAREDLDESILSALGSALLTLDDEAFLKTIKRSGLLPAEDADYDLIREGMETAKRFYSKP